MSDEKRASVPPETTSTFPPGTPLEDVKRARDMKAKQTITAAHRIRQLCTFVTSKPKPG